MLDTNQLLLIILSTGFIILVVFVCVALLTMIKILVDVRKITEIVRHEVENIGSVVDVVSSKTRNFFLNSLVTEKIIPAFLGIFSVAFGAKKMQSLFEYFEEEELKKKKNK